MIAIGALVLSTVTAAPTFGKSGRALMIRAVEVSGNEVAITVANATGRTQTGIVTSRVPTLRGEVNVTIPVIAAAGHTVTVRVVIPDRVIEGLPLGVVVDDGVPF
jgi:hypothetical protein